VRDFIPYGRQEIDEDDIAAVVEVLRGDWLTTGPAVGRFERAFADLVGAEHAVAVTNGTAALHLAMLVAGVGPGDEVIVPTMTFAASANAARYVGAEVRFCDVRPDTLGIDVEHAAALVSPRTRAIVVVDYAGIPCDLDEVMALAAEHGLVVIEDACHAVGATYRGRRVGSIAHLSTFSFHPVKHLTTGEGGMVTTADPDLDRRLRRLRNHGIDSDFRQRETSGTWEYDVVELGFNFRLPDINAALGASQIAKVPRWVERRRAIAARYRELLTDVPVSVLTEPEHVVASWHLFPVLLEAGSRGPDRSEVFARLRGAGIGVNVHYRPLHLHTSFRNDVGELRLPVAEDAYARLLSLPMWHGLEDDEQARVVATLSEVVSSVAGRGSVVG
jgi:perosamine synthetase